MSTTPANARPPTALSRKSLPSPSRWAWGLYLAVGSLLMVLYYLARAEWEQSVVYEGIGLSAAAAIVIGVHWHRPPRRLPWYLLAIGQLCFVAGDLLWDYWQLALGAKPFPSVADVFYLGGYPFLAAGLLLLVRRRIPGGDRASLIDAAIVATGLGVLSWVFLVDPYVQDPSLSPLERLASVAYPLADVLVLGVAARLLAAPGGRPPAYRLLTASLVLNLLADTAFAVLALTDGYQDHGPLDAVWLLSYLFWGAAALHPSMRAVTERATDQLTRLTAGRLAALAGASLLAPAVLAVQFARGESIDAPAIVAGSATGFLLVVARMGGLVQTLAATLRQRQALEEKLTYQAFHDPLTDLANRALFTDRTTHALARRGPDRESVAVLFLDLDDFKTVNDSLGHPVGDDLLTAVAQRIRRTVRAADTVARLGGDEFALLLEDLDSGVGAVGTAERTLAALRAPFDLGGHEVLMHASIGIALGTPGRSRASELLRNADVAMYLAKGQGKDRYEIFDSAMHAALLERLQMRAELHGAVDHGGFAVWYQPIVSLETQATRGIEALVRWKHPKRGLVAPLNFIPLAEESGLILPLGRWILATACADARRWQRRFASHAALTLSVNLSARQLEDPRFVSDVEATLEATDFDPHKLVLEITESVLVRDREITSRNLTALKRLGARVALDDFGTGYSSLSHLRHFPADILKIDRSFVQMLARGPEDDALTRAIIKLGQTLALEIIAEGIEQPAEAASLVAMGCRLGQGYLFAEPLDAGSLERRLEAEATSGDASGSASAPPRAPPRRARRKEWQPTA